MYLKEVTNMNLIERINLFVKEISKDVKNIRGRLVVLENKPAGNIDETALNNKVQESMNGLKTEIPNLVRPTISEEVAKVVGGAPEAFDTLKEIATYIESDKAGASAMANSINNRLRFDEQQTLSDDQKNNVLNSLGLSDVDFVSVYQQGLNG